MALLAGCGLGLAAANVTEYATVLFVPVVVAVVALAAGRAAEPRPRGTRVLGAAMVLAAWALPVAAAVVASERDWPSVWAGALAYPAGDSAVGSVLRDAYVGTSLVLVLAGLGVWLAARSRRPELAPGRFLPVVLLAAALLVPAVQAGRHSTDGLASHLVFGAWFAAIAAGYALARLSRVDRGYGWAAVMALPIAAATLFGSLGGAHALHRGWPDATALVRVLGPATEPIPAATWPKTTRCPPTTCDRRCAGRTGPAPGPSGTGASPRGRRRTRPRSRGTTSRWSSWTSGTPRRPTRRSPRTCGTAAATTCWPARAGSRSGLRAGGAMLVTDSANTEPANTNPASTDPANTDPASTNPASTDPASTDPASTDPASTDPARTDPASTEPATTDLANAEPLGAGTPAELYLPSPPDDQEKYKYFGRPRRLVFAWLLVASAGVLYGYVHVAARAWLVSPLMWLLLMVMVPPVVVNFWLRAGPG